MVNIKKLDEMISILEAFPDGKEIEWDNCGSWQVATNEHEIIRHIHRGRTLRIKPDEPRIIKYLCYENVNGCLIWTKTEPFYTPWIRRPAFDKECLE